MHGRRKLRILSLSEIELFKKFMSGGTFGGIEVNHVNVVNGLRRRGHLVVENQDFPDGTKPDIIICPTYGPVAFINIWRKKKQYNCACVQHAHTTLDDMRGGFIPDGLIPYAGIYLRNLYKFSEVLITPSNFSKRSLQALGIPTRPPIEPVSNGVDLDRFRYTEAGRARFRAFLEEKFGIDPDKTIVLCVGVIWERKGLDVFHAMARRFKEYEFVWVGNYITARSLVKRFDNLPNLTFTGFVDDVVDAYCGADVFFFPSRAENQGIPLLEAAATRLPILCRDLPTYDWMEDGVHCLKSSSDGGFKDKLRRLVEDDDLRARLVENALENVQDHNIEKVLDRIESIYFRAIRIRQKLNEMGR